MGRGTAQRRLRGGGVWRRPLHHAAHGPPPHELRSQGGARVTAPFPTRKQEEWRYADLDALRPVWQQFAEPLTLTVGPGESFEKLWLPSDEEVQVRRVQIALETGAKARIFVLNAASEYGRTELEVSLAKGADFELFGANIGTGLSTNEIVTTVKHIGENGRSRQVVRSVLN